MKFEVHITESLLRQVALRNLLRRWPVILVAAGLIGVSVSMDVRDGSLGTGSAVGLTAIGFQLLVYPSDYTGKS